MAYSWIVERMAEEHRRDLAVARSENRSALQPGDLTVGASLHTVERNPHAQPQLQTESQLQLYGSYGAGRRHVAQHVGSLLIRAGTRLGGASMRTS
jgi:hypothetical protein